tara:strand:+ start:248 stop:490 length:243 start_codon:yes stop_codon:yes gene_type:complete
LGGGNNWGDGMTSNIRTFATQHEKKFIKGLGSFCEEQYLGREELLRKYIKASMKRVNWGDVDQYKTLVYASNCLKVEFNE